MLTFGLLVLGLAVFGEAHRSLLGIDIGMTSLVLSLLSTARRPRRRPYPLRPGRFRARHMFTRRARTVRAREINGGSK